MKSLHFNSLIMAIVSLIFSIDLSAQEKSDSSEAFATTFEQLHLFTDNEPLQLSLQFDLGEFLKTKKEPVYMDALCAMVWEGDTLVKKIQIKARGNMRRAYCQFPPIMLKFGKRKDSFPVNGNMKLVMPCFPTLKYENYTLKEFLVYRLYNVVTPYSLRTRLVRLTIFDSSKQGKSYTAYGFLIENEKSMAERNHSVIVDNPNLTQRHMVPVDITRIAFFNYMIANTDWSVPTQHNIKVVKLNTAYADKGIPVAYDFDYAGFVNPPYAAPAKDLPITEVRERYYLGICENGDILRNVIEEFHDKEAEFINVIEDFNYLPGFEKKYSLSYIENFYRSYKNKDVLFATVNSTCKH